MKGKSSFRRATLSYEALPQVSGAAQPARGFVPFMTVTDLNGRVILTVPRDFGMPEPEWRASVYMAHAAADRYVFVNRGAK